MKKAFFITMSLFILFALVLGARSVMFPVCYLDTFLQYSQEFGVSTELCIAVAKCESDFDTDAVSDAGAIGVMQLLPSTAEFIADKIGYKYEVNLFDYKVNIMLGCAYLSYLSSKFNTEKQVVMAYNAGEGRVREWLVNDESLQDLPYSETKIYYSKVNYAKFVYKNML